MHFSTKNILKSNRNHTPKQRDNSIFPNVFPYKNPDLVNNIGHVKSNSFVRNYCAEKNCEAGSGKWTEDIKSL
jgi:hypothetical protein